MYKEIILDLYKNPRNFRALSNKTHSQRLYNPLCGDDITIDLLVDKADVIQEVGFVGESCAICRASASLLTDYIKGKKRSELVQLNAGFMQDLMGIEISAGRVKCLLLPLEVLKKML
ncbi:iron-sulfur cluster assembly scaffold protein [Candidatus Microgenomates bacterium]|nr:iron-sulfur cluster assembly scaffold protein [Candidatus Microgenomates bacterium]